LEEEFLGVLKPSTNETRWLRINEFFDRIDNRRDDQRKLQRIVDCLLRVTEDDDFGRVMARLMCAYSHASMPPINDCIFETSGVLRFAGIPRGAR
jgi:hypothetical protein